MIATCLSSVFTIRMSAMRGHMRFMDVAAINMITRTDTTSTWCLRKRKIMTMRIPARVMPDPHITESALGDIFLRRRLRETAMTVERIPETNRIAPRIGAMLETVGFWSWQLNLVREQFKGCTCLG